MKNTLTLTLAHTNKRNGNVKQCLFDANNNKAHYVGNKIQMVQNKMVTRPNRDRKRMGKKKHNFNNKSEF